MSQLLGYRKFAGKKDASKRYCVATIASELTERDRESGCVGLKVEDVFMPDEFVDYLQPAHLGKDIFIDYHISNGKAYVRNVTVK